MIGENKKAIVTCIVGGYDVVNDGFPKKEGYDYLLFSDTNIESKNWTNGVVKYNKVLNLDNTRKQRYVKTHLCDLCSEYELVAYIDGNTTIDDKLYSYIENNKDNEVTFKEHPERDCIYDEILEVIMSKKDEFNLCRKIYYKYKSEGYPRYNGLFETM